MVANFTALQLHTVLVQIFEGRIFRRCHKFSIFAILFLRILFLRITGFRIGRLCVHYYIFEDLIFVDHTLSTKTAKFTSLENLYKYGIQYLQILEKPANSHLIVRTIPYGRKI